MTLNQMASVVKHDLEVILEPIVSRTMHATQQIPRSALQGILGNFSHGMKNRIHKSFPSFDPETATEASYNFNAFAYSAAVGIPLLLTGIKEGWPFIGLVGAAAGGVVGGLSMGYIEEVIRKVIDNKPLPDMFGGWATIPHGNAGSLIGALITKPIDYALSVYERAKMRASQS